MNNRVVDAPWLTIPGSFLELGIFFLDQSKAINKMKSNKQRRAELRKLRAEQEAKRKVKAIALEECLKQEKMPKDAVICHPELLAPSNSYGVPLFVTRGYYVDIHFQCADCQKQEVWLAAQQQWWYEVAKGNENAGARRCRPCRKIERDRKTEARRVCLEGLAKKLAANSPTPQD